MTGRVIVVSLALALLMAVATPPSAEAALICSNGFLHYGGSGFFADRAQAEASAIDAWRQVKAQNVGADRAATMLPLSHQMHCSRATGGEGWRCFVRGGHCHAT